MNPVEAKYLIEAIEKEPYVLNNYDKKFIADMKIRILKGIFLTPGQKKHLNHVYYLAAGGVKREYHQRIG